MSEDSFYNKYIKFLFTNALKLDSKSVLFVSMNKNEKLEKIILNHCKDIGMKEENVCIYYSQESEKNEFLKNCNIEDIKDSKLFDNSIWNQYAFKSAHFLIFLDYFNYDSDISLEKLKEAYKIEGKTKAIYNRLVSFNKTKWCCTFLPTIDWFKKIEGKEDVKEEEMYSLINNIYMLDDNFEKFKDHLVEKTNLLNNYNFDRLRIVNNLGTNIDIYLNKSKWINIFNCDVMGKNVFPNYPSYEIYTTPNCEKTNGVVYGSRPIIYNNKLIDEYYLKFENGKVVEFDAKVGYDSLKEIINKDPGSCKLGEVSIVELNTPIYKVNKIFYTTLLDENSSCHIALGMGFRNAFDKELEDDLEKLGVNQSDLHVDFTIGTEDLNIYGYVDSEEYLIYTNGQIVLK